MYLIKIYKFLERKIGNNNNFNIPIKIIRAKKKTHCNFTKHTLMESFEKKISISSPQLSRQILTKKFKNNMS